MKRSTLFIIALVIVAAVAYGFFSAKDSWIRQLPGVNLAEKHEQLTFAVIGDTEGHEDVYRSALKIAKERGASFILHTGDVSADGTAADLQRMAQVGEESGLKITAAIGNHDTRDDGTSDLFRTYFNDPNTAFDRGGYRFLILDNANRKVGFSESTIAWLTQDLAAHPKTAYVIVFHRPFMLPFGAIFGDDETPASRPTNDRVIALLKTVKITAIFTGHLHIYLPYALEGMRVIVTGGGGGEPQAALGALGKHQQHFLLVQDQGNGELSAEVVPLE